MPGDVDILFIYYLNYKINYVMNFNGPDKNVQYIQSSIQQIKYLYNAL